MDKSEHMTQERQRQPTILMRRMKQYHPFFGAVIIFLLCTLAQLVARAVWDSVATGALSLHLSASVVTNTYWLSTAFAVWSYMRIRGEQLRDRQA